MSRQFFLSQYFIALLCFCNKIMFTIYMHAEKSVFVNVKQQ